MARLQAGEKLADLYAPKAAADDTVPRSIDAMHLKNVLGQIQAYYRNIHSDGSSLMWWVDTATLWHFDAGEQGLSTSSGLSAHPLSIRVQTPLEDEASGFHVLPRRLTRS